MNAITLNNITKTYNKKTILAVDDVSFSVPKGEIFGLIGTDGAGKSTVFRMLTTLLLPDSGTASVGGLDVVKDFKAIPRIALKSFTTSKPPTVAVPLSGRRSVVSILNTVLLPAPSGPISPKISPLGTENDTSSTARIVFLL